MIADRIIDARENGWQDRNHDGWKVDRTMGFAHLAARRSTTRRTT